jgi:hypothetical protein
MDFGIQQQQTDSEKKQKQKLLSFLKNTPIPDPELLSNLGLYVNRQLLSRFLFLDSLYKKIVGQHGVIMEFGVRWGQNIGLLSSLRGIYEPYNISRKIIGFDTFAGFMEADLKKEKVNNQKGDYGVVPNYQPYLEEIMDYHQSESPISHIKRFELVKGDVNKTVDEYFKNHPETIVAFAYFDLDLYAPTVACLKAIREHCPMGAILAFDELCNPHFPGETKAFQEMLGISNQTIQRSPLSPWASYIVLQ